MQSSLHKPLLKFLKDIPGDAYYSGLLGTSYDYAYPTVAQTNAGGRTLTWPRGKVLGGSSAVNGMYMVRPSALEYDTWAGLVAGQDGADAWKWDYQFQSLKKAETFTPPSADLASQNDLLYSMDSHGTSGPVHTSWPGLCVIFKNFLTPLIYTHHTVSSQLLATGLRLFRQPTSR